MNCAYHADQSAVAYCRTCGKALCANCTRPVRGVIYCEDCLGQRMEGVPQGGVHAASLPAAGLVAGTPGGATGGWTPVNPGAVQAQAVPTGSGPNPTVAGILAGFFPFGVGAVYTGQYAKGLAHLVIFGLLVAGCNAASESSHGDMLAVICGLGLAFFYVYQIVDAVRSARALQLGQPAPDPYGLGATFGGGSKVDTNKIPVGAIVLIVLGGLFLLSTMGLDIGLDRFWPVILIVLGGWMFARNWGPRPDRAARLQDKMARRGVPSAMQDAVVAMAYCHCTRCRSQRLMGPAVLVTIGFLFLFETLGKLGFGHTWPILLLVVGGVKLFQSRASTDGHMGAFPPTPGGGTPTATAPPNVPPPPAPPTPSTPSAGPSEVSHG
jgi:hypothetical protein